MWLTIHPAAPISSRRQTFDSDDSEYGARSKKKKRRPAADEVRSSARTGKMPNYNDDVKDFDQSDNPDPGYYYVDVSQQQESDEIEAVLGHVRDEDDMDDPEDIMTENVVSVS